jgi:hypothetical protein
MRLAPDDGDTMSHAERALTSLYPLEANSEYVMNLLTELVWGTRGCLGPSWANAACVEFQFVSQRDDEIWTQRFEHGNPAGPAYSIAPNVKPITSTSNTIRLRTSGKVDIAAVDTFLQALRSQIPSRQISRVESVDDLGLGW